MAPARKVTARAARCNAASYWHDPPRAGDDSTFMTCTNCEDTIEEDEIEYPGGKMLGFTIPSGTFCSTICLDEHIEVILTS